MWQQVTDYKMWQQVTDYLNDLAKLLLCKPSDLVLQRADRNSANWITVTEKNADWGYLKPDVGYGSPLLGFRVMISETTLVTSWNLYEFPSCCAFCVSTRVHVADKFRKLGINTRSNMFRQQLAKVAGYTTLLCTDILSNTAERKTLAKNGFKDVYQIRNKRTGNDVVISAKEL